MMNVSSTIGPSTPTAIPMMTPLSNLDVDSFGFVKGEVTVLESMSFSTIVCLHVFNNYAAIMACIQNIDYIIQNLLVSLRLTVGDGNGIS